MKRILLLISILFPLVSSAQGEALISYDDSTKSMLRNFRHIKSHINLEFASSGNMYFTSGSFDELSFKMNRIRLEILGQLNEDLSYHFRQSFNKYSNPNSVDNLSSSIEYANIRWHHRGGRFDLVAGKQFVAVAGYEGYVNGLMVREFSDFNNNFEIYQTGVMGIFRITPDHQLTLQVTNNRNSIDGQVPEGMKRTRFPLLATANWNGWFADGSVHLMYSASAGQLAKGKNVYYLMCGNIYEKGPVLAYLDVLYSRSAIDNQQRVTNLQGLPGSARVTAQNTEYLTLIANVDYRFHPKWNGYVKGAYETAGVYEANGIFNKGNYLTSWNAQACVEWFPFAEDGGFKVFLHYLYKGYSLTENAVALGSVMPHTQRLSLGIQYIIPVL